MNQSKIAAMLKVTVIGFALCVLIAYGLVIPIIANEVVFYYPEFVKWYMPWIIYISVTAVPIFIAIIYAWKVVVNIGEDHSFCQENADCFKKIAILATVDTIYFIFGQLVLWLLNMNHPGIVVGSLVIGFVGFAVVIVCTALSLLIKKAAILQDDSDLTI